MIEEFTMILLKHNWFVAVNETEKEFWTSDNPLVMYGHLGNHGLNSKGIELIFPITPKLALVLREYEHFKAEISKNNKFVMVNSNYVDYCNSLQVYQSYRNIFAKKSTFSLGFELLKHKPQLSDINRNRFKVD